MPFKIALIIAIIFQVTSVMIALRLHWKYRAHSAWIMISSAALLVAILELGTLMLIWKFDSQVASSMPLWTACLSAVIVSVLFLGGFTLIEPLFVDLSEAAQLLRKEKRQLEYAVQATEDELRLARQIQQNLLPDKAPDQPGLEIAGASEPADWTSGDYYDYISSKDGVIVVVADVSGHGTGPALLMVETRAFLRILSGGERDVGEIMTRTNHAISADIETNQFVTAFVLEITSPDRKMVYAAAGHDAILIDASGGHRVFDADKPPLGIDADLIFEASSPVDFATGEIMLLMTDGIPEASAPSGEHFGTERAIEVVHANRSQSAKKIVAALFEAVNKFVGNARLSDDVTAVIIKAV